MFERVKITVITPYLSCNLTTLERAKLRFKKSDTTDDDFLEKLAIPACSSRAASYCNREFGTQTYEDTFRQPHHRHWLFEGFRHTHRDDVIVLRQAPIRAIQSVTEDGVSLTENVDFDFDDESGLLYLLGGKSFQTLIVR